MRNRLVGWGIAAAVLTAAITMPGMMPRTMPSVSAAPARRSHPARAASGGIVWKTSLRDAQREAKRTGKPIMIKFHATWCGPCHDLQKQTFSSKAVAAEARKWIAVQVDVDKNPTIANRYSVNVLPTVVFLKPDGEQASSFNGFRTAAEAIKLMKTAFVKATQEELVTASRTLMPTRVRI